MWDICYTVDKFGSHTDDNNIIMEKKEDSRDLWGDVSLCQHTGATISEIPISDVAN